MVGSAKVQVACIVLLLIITFLFLLMFEPFFEIRCTCCSSFGARTLANHIGNLGYEQKI